MKVKTSDDGISKKKIEYLTDEIMSRKPLDENAFMATDSEESRRRSSRRRAAPMTFRMALCVFARVRVVNSAT